MTDKKIWLIASVILACAAGLHLYNRGQFTSASTELDIDLAQPDAYLQSQKISALPADLVKMPGLNTVLTQEFVNYYEEHPDKLSLEGALRRLAYEHQLTWQEKLVARLLDTPGEVALWRDGKGKLSYFAIVLQKNLTASLAEQVAKVVLPDKQLTNAGELKVNGSTVTVYALTLRNDRTWLFASHGEKILLLSHPGMLLQADKQLSGSAAKTAQDLLSKSSTRPWKEYFHLSADNPPTMQHTAAVKASFLSFGYQHFFPGVYALEVQMHANNTWQVRAAASETAWTGWTTAAAHAWSVMPRGAALCTALPMDWTRAEPALQVAIGGVSKALSSDLVAGAGVCWYANGGLYAPMLAARLKPGDNTRHDASLKQLLTASLSAKKPIKDITEKKLDAANMLWTKDIFAPTGSLVNKEGPLHRVSLARLGDTLITSIDHKLVEQAISVNAKTYPALADDYPAAPVLISQWAQVAKMLEAESLRLATRAESPLFHTVSREQLKPRLDALANTGNMVWTVPKSSAKTSASGGWLWQPLAITLPETARK